jgi:uncharacterized protein
MSEIHELRAKKDEFLANDPASPLGPEQRERFDGLEYFRVDPAYRVRATVTEFEPQRVVVLETSRGSGAHFWRFGWAKFELFGKRECLTLYLPADSTRRDSFFVPFTDLTTGGQSYAGGRYLDVRPDPDGLVTLDFNLAYNPYCAYDPRWDCVKPPVENHVEQPVRAGERVFPG